MSIIECETVIGYDHGTRRVAEVVENGPCIGPAGRLAAKKQMSALYCLSADTLALMAKNCFSCFVSSI